jgi:spermidine/putrescine ABC transporter ATP-binding subunit
MGIELRTITKQYGAQRALEDVSLSVADGEFVTLLGPSGCGKTTLLRIIAGFIEATAGDVLLDGRSIMRLAPNQRHVGLVFQSYALFPHMSVGENVAFGLRMRRVSPDRLSRKVSEVLDLVGMRDLADRYPAQLSGGQQQRVALARTLAVEPRILLLDEPFAALDRRLRVQMRAELKRLIHRIGITTIFVTHDQEEALTMSDYVAVMDRGRIVQHGTPMDVYDHPQTPFVASFLGSSNLWAGTLRRDETGQLLFDSPDVCLPVPEDVFGVAEQLAAHQPVTLLLRPEHLRIAAEPAAADGLPGTVAFVTHLGETTSYDVLLDSGAQLRVETSRTRNQTPFVEGTRVRVGPADPSAFWIIEGD